MPEQKEKVMVCIAAGTHTVNARIMTFAVEVGQKCPDRAFRLSVVDGAKGYDFPRNQLARLFLSSDADRLWFIDDDTVPPDNAVEMLETDADIVTGLVPVFKGGNPGTMYFNAYTYVGEKDKYRPMNPEVAPVSETIDAGGCAAMLIRRKVLEDKRMWFNSEWMDIEGTVRQLSDAEAPPIFKTLVKPNGDIYLGEDFYFCYRAKGLGYSIKCYSGTQWGHLKMVNLMDMLKLQQVMYEKGVESLSVPVGA